MKTVKETQENAKEFDSRKRAGNGELASDKSFNLSSEDRDNRTAATRRRANLNNTEEILEPNDYVSQGAEEEEEEYMPYDEGCGQGPRFVSPYGFLPIHPITRTSVTKIGRKIRSFRILRDEFYPDPQCIKTIDEAGITSLFDDYTNIDEVRLKMANNIKLLRKYLGLSSERLANEVEVSRQYINQIENCKRNPSVDILCRIANSLHTTPEILMSANLPNHYIYYLQVLIYELSRKAPEKQEDILKEAIMYIANA